MRGQWAWRRSSDLPYHRRTEARCCMLTRRKLLALVGSAGLGVVGAATAITIQRARSGGPKAPVDQAKLETVTLTIRGMI